MTETEKLGSVIVAAVKATTGSLLAELAVLSARMSAMDVLMSEAATERAALIARNTALEQKLGLVEMRPWEPQEVWQTIKAGTIDLRERIEALETREAIPGPIGPAGEPGKDGHSLTVEDIAPFITSEVAWAIGALPPPKDGTPGRDVDPEDVKAIVRSEVLEAVAALPEPDLAPIVEAEVAKAVSMIPAAKDGAPGQSVDPAEMDALLQMKVSAAVAALPLPKDGQSVTLDDVAPLILAEVTRAVNALPQPMDGKDGMSITVEDVVPLIASEVEKAVALIPPPKDGAPGPPVDQAELNAFVLRTVGEAVAALPEPNVAPLIASEVGKAVAAIPKPKDGEPGRSVDVAEIETMVTSRVEQAVAALPPAKDAVGIVDALIDRDGQLILTLSDGTAKHVGPVVGRDVDMAAVARLIADELATWPRPKDGEAGPPGRDGTLESVTVKQIDDRTAEFCRPDGSVLGAMHFAVPLDRGVWTPKAWDRGDGVTYAGSWFIAQRATLPEEKPEDASGAWRLSVKRGRDAKPGPTGPPGDRGPKGDKGDPGRDYR